MPLTIKKFSDVYSTESKYGEGVSANGTPLAYWKVSGPSAPPAKWMDMYAGLDDQSNKVYRLEGTVKTYDVQALRMSKDGKWCVIVSNVTSKTDTSVETLLREVAEVRNLKDLFVKLWKDEPYTNPHPDALAEYHAGKRGQKDPNANCAHANLANPKNFGYFSNR